MWIFHPYRPKSEVSASIIPRSLINGLLLHVFVLTTQNFKLFAFGDSNDLDRFKLRTSTKPLVLECFSEDNVTREPALGTGGEAVGTVSFIPLPGTQGKEYLETLLDQENLRIEADGTSVYTRRSLQGEKKAVQGEYAGDFTRLSSRLGSFAKHFMDVSLAKKLLKQGNLSTTDLLVLIYSYFKPTSRLRM